TLTGHAPAGRNRWRYAGPRPHRMPWPVRAAPWPLLCAPANSRRDQARAGFRFLRQYERNVQPLSWDRAGNAALPSPRLNAHQRDRTLSWAEPLRARRDRLLARHARPAAYAPVGGAQATTDRD